MERLNYQKLASSVQSNSHNMISQVFIFVAVVSITAASIDPIVHHAPHPYKFGYDVKDAHGEQYRHEEGNGGHAVKGSYGFTDGRGIKRQVNYVADQAGFRAQVNTNEPGTANSNPAAVEIKSDAHHAGAAALGGLGYGQGYGNLGNGIEYGGHGLGGHGYGSHDGYGGDAGYGGHGHGGLGYGMGYGLGGLGYARYGY